MGAFAPYQDSLEYCYRHYGQQHDHDCDALISSGPSTARREFDQRRAPGCCIFFAAGRDFAFGDVPDFALLRDPRARPVAFFASYRSGYDMPPTKIPSA
jgi:hypothetical protein